MQTVSKHVFISKSSETANRVPSRRDLIFLFLAFLALFSYSAPRWNDWNQNSRLNLVRSIVDSGTVRIDAYYDSTGDYAFYNGHYYSDKPPGPALAGVVPYAALKLALSNPVADWALEKMGKSSSFSKTFTEGTNYGESVTTPRDKIIGALGRILISILLVSIPTALMLALFWLWAARLTGRYWLSLTITLALGLGTTLFPYASLFYNHALTAALLFISFYLIGGRSKEQKARSKKGNQRDAEESTPPSLLGKGAGGLGLPTTDNRQPTTFLLVGFLLGFSLISQYETALIVGPLGLYALYKGRRTDKKGFFSSFILHPSSFLLMLGALPNLIALVIYDLIAFGTPAPVGYQYSILWLDKHQQGFMSLTFPHPDALWGLTFSPYRGIFLLSPFLLLAIPGFYFGLKRVGLRLEAALCLWSTIAFYLLNASSVMWWGGHTFGPRYMISALPFMAFGVVLLLREATLHNWKGVNWLFDVPAALSILIILPASLAGRQWPSEVYQSPLTDYLWPQLFAGNLARNPGMAVGLKGLLSYLPLVLAVGIIYLLLYRWPKANKAGRSGKKELVVMSSTVEAGPTAIKDEVERMKDEVKSNKSLLSYRLAFPTISILLLVILTSLPYIFGYLRAPAGKSFMGIMLDVPDTTQYWAWMREMGKNFVIVNPLTPEPNDPIFFNLLWLVLGRAGALTGLAQEWIYQLFRIASIIFFGTMAWGFTRFIFARPLAQRTAYVLIMFGCGWGFVPIIIKQFSGILSNPLAVFVAEPNTFLSALAFPHLIFSAGLILGVFWLALQANESGKLKFAGWAAGLALVLGLEHTYDLVIVYATIGVYWLWRMWQAKKIDWRWFQICLIIGLVSALPSLYSVYITTANATWKGVLAQYGNAGVFTPDPLNLVILIGPLLLLAFAGLFAAQPPSLNSQTPSEMQTGKDRLQFIKVWFVVGCFLIYIPANFQIKMLNGWQVPIFLLATAALFDPVNSFITKRFTSLLVTRYSLQLLCVVAVLIAIPTSLYLFSWRFVDLNRTGMPYYLEKDELAAMSYVEKAPSGIVLTSEELGQYVAPRTGQRPFLAHWAMTLDYYTKRDLVAKTLDPKTTPEARATILKQYNVKYVLYGAADKQLAPELTDPNLKKVFSSPKADVYEFGG